VSFEQDTVQHAVEAARKAGAAHVDAWLSSGTEFSVKVLNSEIDQLEEAESRVLGIRVFTGNRTALVYSSDVGPDAIDSIASEAVDLARLTGEDSCAGLPDGPFADNHSASDLELFDEGLFTHDPATLVEMAREAERVARAHDPRITNSEGATVSRRAGTIAMANSKGFTGSYRATACSLSASALADDADFKKREATWRSAARFFNDLESPETVGRIAGEHAVRQLGSRTVETRDVPVVWSPEIGTALLRLVAQAASGSARYQGSSFLIDREGEMLASDLVTIVDDATLPGRLGSRPFDGEGLVSRATKIFEAGVFQTFLFDTYSARRSGMESTANAGRSVAFQQGMTIGVSPTNLSLSPGTQTAESIIGQVNQGLYLTGMLGHGDNLTTGDFSRGATGIWIENGELAYPVSEINISGNLRDMLAGIDAVGDDQTVFGTYASPTFRVARMTVSGS